MLFGNLLSHIIYFSIYTEEIDEGPGVSNKIYNKCEDITLTTQHVATKLNQLNISKSPGPDLIHPRVLYEIRDVIASTEVIV